jgi:hypothetical protein
MRLVSGAEIRRQGWCVAETKKEHPVTVARLSRNAAVSASPEGMGRGRSRRRRLNA